MNDVEVNAVARLLEWLVRDGHNYFAGQPPRTHRLAHARLAERYQPMSKGYVDRFKSTADISLELHIHARPILHGSPVLFPVGKVRWKVTSQQLAMAVRFALFEVEVDDHDQVTIASSRGWRFETPSILDFIDDPPPPAGAQQPPVDHPFGGAGLHDHYHAQAIAAFSKDTDQFDNLVGPTNTTQPAFRLLARDAPTLVVASLVSLYGLDPFLGDLVHLPGLNQAVKEPLRPYQVTAPGRGNRR